MITAELKFCFPDDFSNMVDTFDLFRRLSVGAKFNKKKFHIDQENVKVSLSRACFQTFGQRISVTDNLNYKTLDTKLTCSFL